jgi:hypothetical protein
MQQPKQTQPPAIRGIERLDAQSIRALEKALPKPVINSNSSPQETGYLLGIQLVLNKLREGWLVGY